MRSERASRKLRRWSRTDLRQSQQHSAGSSGDRGASGGQSRYLQVRVGSVARRTQDPQLRA